MFAYLYAIWNIALALEMWEFTMSNSQKLRFQEMREQKGQSQNFS